MARCVVVVSREPDPPPPVAALGERCLAFVADALVPDGRCHNRMSYSRRWEDEAGDGDWWGRALWGLGTAAASHRDRWVREDALRCFETGARQRSPWPRAMAFATLGAAEVLRNHPAHAGARSLVMDGVQAVGRPASSGTWPWPEPRLTYANAVLPESLIAAGVGIGNGALLAEGLDLLGWLLDTETLGGHLSLTPVDGWAPGEPRPGFDQQPIEAASLAEACARAFDATRELRWSAGVDLALAWFFGNNDRGVAMYDHDSGGGYDGLERTGRNENQGAESTLALIATRQHGRRLVPSLS